MNDKLKNVWKWPWPNHDTVLEFVAKTKGNYGKQRTIDVPAKIKTEGL
jgi:hypothetical protein